MSQTDYSILFNALIEHIQSDPLLKTEVYLCKHNKLLFDSSSQMVTQALAATMGKCLLTLSKRPWLVALQGNLGAGKTTFVKGLSAGLGLSAEEVQSPTFTYLYTYGQEFPLFHFDLYRLVNNEDFVAMGFEDYFHMNGVCCIEWSERIASLLPRNLLTITLAHTENNPNHRAIEFSL